MRTKLRSIFSPKHSSGDTRGFTLVELITAMTLLALVSVMLFSICTAAIHLIYRNNAKQNTLSGAKTGLNNSLSGQTGALSTTQDSSVGVQFGVSTPVVVPGKRVNVESKDDADGSIESDMYAFIPD